MPTRTDLDVQREHIYTRAGEVFQDFVPEGITGLALDARHLSGQIIGRTLDGRYCWSEDRWLVEVSAVTEDYTDLNTAAALLQTALDTGGTSYTYTNGTVYASRLAAGFQQADVAPGESTKRMGGEFLIAAKGS
jgi:hypothetical protein